MSLLSKELYRTSKKVLEACRDLGIEFNPEDLEDLEQCICCDTWYHSYELEADTDFCKYCEYTYG